MEIVKNAKDLELELDCSDPLQRRKNLDIMCEILDGTPSDQFVQDVWEERHAALLRHCGGFSAGDSERCRESAAECVLSCLRRGAAEARDTRPHYVLPMLYARMVDGGGPEGTEKSEEVRAILAKILEALLDKHAKEDAGEVLSPYVEDLGAVIAACLSDNHPETKLEGAKCVEAMGRTGVLGKVGPRGPEPLATAALSNLPHRLRRVRLSSLLALGECLARCESEAFRGAAPGLAQRLFDPAPEVRAGVAQVAGKLLREWTHRYDNHALLVPLLITGLEDELEEVVDKVRAEWERAGQKWLEEESARDRRVKDMIDFPAPPPEHYPSGVVRPGLGCRMMASRVFFRLKEAIRRDITDWLPETRTKASELLCQLLIHLEEDLIGHAEAVLNIFTGAINDVEENVVKNVCRSAVLFGYFVPPKVWLSIKHQRLQKSVQAHDLRILSHLILGSNPCLLRPHLADLALCLQEDRVCHLRDDEYQTELVSCASSLLSVCGRACREEEAVEAALFLVAVSARAMAQYPELAQKATELLNRLQSELGHPDRKDLFSRQMGPLLRKYAGSCHKWNAQSHEAAVFATLVRESGGAAGLFAEQVVGIFEKALQPSRDAAPELQVRFLMVLAQQLMSICRGTEEEEELEAKCRKVAAEGGSWQEFSYHIVTGLIVPRLSFRAGKKHHAVRTAAAATLWSLLSSGAADRKGALRAMTKIREPMKKLADDCTTEKVRIYVARCYRLLFLLCGEELPSTDVREFCEVLLGRLNDSSAAVRTYALSAMAAASACLRRDVVRLTPLPPPPEDGNKDEKEETKKEFDKDFLGEVFSTLLVHMDDREGSVRKGALAALISLGRLDPHLLSENMGTSAKDATHREEVDKLGEWMAKGEQQDNDPNKPNEKDFFACHCSNALCEMCR